MGSGRVRGGRGRRGCPSAMAGAALILLAIVWVAVIEYCAEREALAYRKLAEISGGSGTMAECIIENAFEEQEAGGEAKEAFASDRGAGSVLEPPYDWDALADINRDIIGWLYLPNLIDLPVAGALDNEFYLSHDFMGEKSRSGCLFMDRDTEEGDFNRVIYGHNMGIGSDAMFSVLLRYEDADYFEENSVLFYTDRYENMTAYDVIAVVKYDVNDVGEWDFRTRRHESGEDYLAWMTQLKERAFLYREPEKLPEGLITLATCDRRIYGKDGRFLIIGGR